MLTILLMLVVGYASAESEPQCDWPRQIENGRYWYKRFNSAFYLCDSGYKVAPEMATDRAEVQCAEGMELPKCVKDSCHWPWLPRTIDNGRLSRHNSQGAWYKCDRGYKLSADSDQNGMTSCKDNVLILPVCEKDNCVGFPRTIDNGRYYGKNSQGGALYKCDRGYKFSADSDQKGMTSCKDNVLILPVCEKDNCIDFPRTIDNGRYYGKNSQGGAWYKCDHGYKFTKESDQKGMTSCKDNVLILPVCEKDNCKDFPRTIDNGRMSHYNSQGAWYRCDRGYKLSADSHERGMTSCVDNVLLLPKCELDQ